MKKGAAVQHDSKESNETTATAAKDDAKVEEQEEEGDEEEAPTSAWCGCSSCEERQNIEDEQVQEVERLRSCWSQLREEVAKVYRMVLDGSWSSADSEGSRPDLTATKERVHRLCWRDAHQLYLRLEAGVKEFVLELKLKLIELLQKQAKNPSLAQEFIQSKRLLHLPLPLQFCIP